MYRQRQPLGPVYIVCVAVVCVYYSRWVCLLYPLDTCFTTVGAVYRSRWTSLGALKLLQYVFLPKKFRELSQAVGFMAGCKGV